MSLRADLQAYALWLPLATSDHGDISCFAQPPGLCLKVGFAACSARNDPSCEALKPSTGPFAELSIAT